MSISAADPALEPQAPDAFAPVAQPAARSAESVWVWQVTALSLALGVMLALAMRTTARLKKAGIPSSRLGVSAAVLSAYREQNDRQGDEIARLRDQAQQFRESFNSTSKSQDMLKQQLDELRGLAGMTSVYGPGLRISLKDSTETQLRVPGLPPEEYENFNVHDQDINGLINELKAAGAEAIAISGADGRNLQRVVVTTTARCVGPNTIVNGVQLSAPYTILAIGNQKELRAALEMPNGFVETRGLDLLKMIQIEEADRVVLPEYSGSFTLRYARPTAPNP